MKGYCHFIIIVICFIHGCTDPASRVDINYKFQGKPPYQELPKVTNVTTNLYRVEIKMDPDEIGSMYYVFHIGESKMVLRDDGRAGDIEKGDGIYTLMYNDQGEFLKELDANMNAFHKAFNKHEFICKVIGSRTVRINTQEILDFEKSLRFTKTLKGIRIPLDLVQFPFLSDGHISNIMSIEPSQPLFNLDYCKTIDSEGVKNTSTMVGSKVRSIRYFDTKLKP